MRFPVGFWWALVSLGPMVVGAFGPWAKVEELHVSVSGTDEGNDGWLVVGAAAAAAVFLALYARSRRRWPAVLAFLAGCAACAVTAYDVADIENVTSGFASLIDPGWGIYVALGGAVSLMLASVVLAVGTRRPA